MRLKEALRACSCCNSKTAGGRLVSCWQCETSNSLSLEKEKGTGEGRGREGRDMEVGWAIDVREGRRGCKDGAQRLRSKCEWDEVRNGTSMTTH